MPNRGPSIDPSLPLGRQRIPTSVVMPLGWIPVLKQLARDNEISYSRQVCEAIEFYAKAKKIDLAPA